MVTRMLITGLGDGRTNLCRRAWVENFNFNSSVWLFWITSSEIRIEVNDKIASVHNA